MNPSQTIIFPNMKPRLRPNLNPSCTFNLKCSSSLHICQPKIQPQKINMSHPTQEESAQSSHLSFCFALSGSVDAEFHVQCISRWLPVALPLAHTGIRGSVRNPCGSLQERKTDHGLDTSRYQLRKVTMIYYHRLSMQNQYLENQYYINM